MRIYKFAQQKNISNKEVLDKLQEGGFPSKSHMSLLDEKAIAFLESVFSVTRQKKDSSEEILLTANQPPINEIKNTVSESAIKSKKSTETKKYHTETKEVKRVDTKKNQEKVAPAEADVRLVIQQMSVAVFAERVKKSVTDVIVTLLKWGVIATRNQVISEAIVKKLADHYEIECIGNVAKQDVADQEKKPRSNGLLKRRLPIVVVVGHVDHGKTTLLDHIRKTRVALKEKGGITQHLGAYEATTSHGNIVFLDTPGHEAFGKIRQRGIKVADLVVLVVAADDGVMPQTVEAIKYAQSMKVPIVVAINKMDKADSSRIETIKRQLNQYGIIVEDWGGDVVCVPMSAKNGTGVDQLLEMLALQAEMMELRAEVDVPAVGYILEASLEKGRGYVATVIAQSGVIRVGDYFSCGKTSGRVSSFIDSAGQRLQEALPSIPVQVAGFNDLPEAGDLFEVVPKPEYLKIKSSSGDRESLAGKHYVYQDGINLLVKADNHSSLEAVVEGIGKLSKKLKKGFNVLRSAVGDVSEGDIEFAYNTGARIVCFNVKVETNAQLLGSQKSVNVMHFGIIYKLLEELDALAEAAKDIEYIRTKTGEAAIIKVFDIKKIGIIAGAMIRDGRFVRDGFVTVTRGRAKIGEGKITSLQREKKTVKEVFTGFECAFMVNGFVDWQIDDKVECFIDVPKK